MTNIIKKKKPPYKAFAAVFVLLLVMGYYIGGVLDFPNWINHIDTAILDVFTHPIRNYWSKNTIMVWGCCLIGWVLFVASYLDHHRNTHSDVEHGSSEWADVDQVRKELYDSEHPENNRILSKHIQVALDGPKSLSNNNIMFVGAPGTGKSLFEVCPNILTYSASYVLLDIKGELLQKYGNALKKHGYKIHVLNLKEMDKSDRYNPFAYLRNEDDIPRIIMNIFKSVEPPDAQKGDPFWDDGCALYLQSLFYFTWMVPEDEKRMLFRQCRIPWKTVFETATMNQIGELTVLESDACPTEEDENRTKLSILMDSLDELHPGHPAVRDYRKLKEGAPETVSSVILILNGKLKFFNSPSIRRIFAADDMNLREIGIGQHGDGKTKTALFLVLKENDASYNFMVNMLYQQLFNELVLAADLECKGRLPIRVEFWMDEFANGVRPERFENLITTLRSRNIAAMMFVQSFGQLKTMYKNDAYEILMDACSVLVFLGAGRGALNTQKMISDLLDQATIEKTSGSVSYGQNGSSNTSYDRLQRSLMTPSEVGRMDKKQCIIFIEGRQPILDNKYRPFHDANYIEAMELGPYEHPVKIKKLEDGSLETISYEEGFYFPDPEEQKRIMEKFQSGKSNDLVIELTEEEFCSLKFPSVSESDTEKDRSMIIQQLEEIEKKNQEKTIQEKSVSLNQKNTTSNSQSGNLKDQSSKSTENKIWNLDGTLQDVIENNLDNLTEEGMEEIMLGLQHGLSEEQIKCYLVLPIGKMRQMRLFYELENEKKGV